MNARTENLAIAKPGCTVTVLEAFENLPAAKKWDPDGHIQQYAKLRNFKPHEITVGDIHELSALLTRIEPESNKLIIRGGFCGMDEAPNRETIEYAGRVRRLKKLFEDIARHWVLIEVDGYPTQADPILEPEAATEEYIAKELPEAFHGRSYHWQLSNSAGHTRKPHLRVHIWFWLETPYTSAQLREWANAYGLKADKSVFDEIQIHYTASPQFAPGVSCPVKVRSRFVQGLLGDDVPLDVTDIPADRAAAAHASAPGRLSYPERLAAEIELCGFARHLDATGQIAGHLPQGKLILRQCPNHEAHSSNTDGTSSTIAALPGYTGATGNQTTVIVCKHDSCQNITPAQWRELAGYVDPDIAATFADFAAIAPAKDIPKPERAQIVLKAGEQPATLRQLGEALGKWAPHTSMMAFAGQLCTAYLAERRGFRGEPVRSLELNALRPASLAAYANLIATFVRKKKAKGGAVQTVKQDCPTQLAAVLLELPEHWPGYGIPMVDRIAETPLVINGQLYSEPGFCDEAGVWIHAPPDVRLPEPLDRAAAERAFARLREWWAEFPWETPIDEAVALSAMLQAATRASLPAAPGTCFDKPSYGSGASTAAKLLHIILTGRAPAVLSADRGEEELSKSIDAAQMAGASAIVLDNLKTGDVLRSIALAQTLSEPHRKARVLGASRSITVACSQMVIATGVNVGVADDLVRRFLRGRINPNCENPQEREFKRPNLLEEAAEQRAAILSDLYTVALAYVHSGERARVTRLAGYDDWSRMCAEPIVWLGLPDPVTSSQALQTEDPARTALAELLETWEAAYGDVALTVARLLNDDTADEPDIGVSQDKQRSDEEKKREGAKLQLRALLLRNANCDSRTADPSRAVGRYLSAHKGMMIGGRRLDRTGSRQGVSTWRVRA